MLNEQAYLGGKNINNNGGTIADFLFQNSITKNITVIEIKTPSEQLITDNKYREKVYNMNPNLINALNQLLIEKQTLNRKVSGSADVDSSLHKGEGFLFLLLILTQGHPCLCV